MSRGRIFILARKNEEKYSLEEKQAAVETVTATETAEEKDEGDDAEDETETTSSNAAVTLLLVVLLLAGIGGAALYLCKKPDLGKKPAKGDKPDPDADKTDGGVIYDLPEENEDNPNDFKTDDI